MATNEENGMQVWVYHLNPKNQHGYAYEGWDPRSPSSIREGGHRWEALQMFRQVRVGDPIFLFFKNIRPRLDGIYVAGEITRVDRTKRLIDWRADRAVTKRLLANPIPQKVVRRAFGISHGHSLQRLRAASASRWIALISKHVKLRIGKEPSSPNAEPAAGAGFGRPESNKKVEAAACRAVRRLYESGGWQVRSVERDRVGYDLHCTKANIERHVEVKGIRGQDQCFLLTAGELGRASSDQDFRIAVVTNALSSHRGIQEINYKQWRRLTETRKILLKPVNYSVVIRR